jgi:XRE family transcriptional regulator, fatty acid utilization regulator
MPMSALTGTRIRERRLLVEMRQADLAKGAGISASYLNLIEHNRRRIGPDILARLAAVLGVEQSALTEGATDVVLDGLREAAASFAVAPADQPGAGAAVPELARTEEFVGRFPGWAGLLAAQNSRIAKLERTVEALSDRMAHDPFLSTALHEVLSSVSSVRSTAAILAETEDIAPEWRARFHGNLHADSERLAEGAEALVAYLDGSDQAEERGIAAPQEEIEAWLETRGWHVAELEAGGAAREIEALIAGATEIASAAARTLARDWLTRYASDAALLPMAAMVDAVARFGPDPGVLVQHFGADVMAVFRRLAAVPDLGAGLVVCDGSGTLVFRKPAEGFALPRFGAACPLWPLYTALVRPMSPVAGDVITAGRTPRRYRTYALCRPTFPQGFDGPQVVEAAMLVLPQDPGLGLGKGAIEIGTSCRICPRQGCVARREPSIMSEGE